MQCGSGKLTGCIDPSQLCYVDSDLMEIAEEFSIITFDNTLIEAKS